MDHAAAEKHLPELASFINAFLESVNLDETTVILTSDHGNLEDLSIRNHTLNDVPTVVWGRGNQEAAGTIRDLADITPAIIGLLHRF
jgi:bisphosphoglycerate-independent phosphoglycerate mutase (AlkP superfamily)